MPNSFRSAWRRIERAKSHVGLFNNSYKEFIDSHPYTMAADPDPDGVREHWKLKLTESIPDALEDSAADAIDVFRSSLDHAGYAIAELFGKSESKSAFFPFAESASELENVIKGRCKDIPDQFKTLFRSFQPFKGGNGVLWTANKLRKTNQHKFLSTIGHISNSTNVNMQGGRIYWAAFPPIWDNQKGEAHFATVDKNYKPEFRFDFALELIFNDTDAIGIRPARAFLANLSYTCTDILNQIQAQCIAMGK